MLEWEHGYVGVTYTLGIPAPAWAFLIISRAQ